MAKDEVISKEELSMLDPKLFSGETNFQDLTAEQKLEWLYQARVFIEQSKSVVKES